MAWSTSTHQIRYGNPGNRQTLKQMSRLALRGSHDTRVIQAAHDIVRNVPERNDMATFEAVLADVRARMRYTHDPLGAELVKDPAYVIGMSDSYGLQKEPMDCDDASVLAASMLGALGYRTEFVTVATDAARGGEWGHVYLRAQRNDGRWVAMDPIVREFRLGQEVPAERLMAPRAYHEGVTPMRMGCDRAMAGFGRLGAVEQSWWEQLLGTASTAFTEKSKASLASSAAKIAAANAQRDAALARADARRAAAGGSLFNFTKPDGTTDVTKVALVVGGAAVVGFVLLKAIKRGR